jgi:hypothetical protein
MAFGEQMLNAALFGSPTKSAKSPQADTPYN